MEYTEYRGGGATVNQTVFSGGKPGLCRGGITVS